MRKKDISDAIGNINDRYIEEAADFQRKKKRNLLSSMKACKSPWITVI